MPIPNYIADLIYQHPETRGEIYQCGALEIPGMAKTLNIRGYIHCAPIVEALRDHGVSLIAFTAGCFQPQLEKEGGIDVIHAPFADSEDLERADIIAIKTMITEGAIRVAQAVKESKRVLSTCWGGLNRSSLLTAFAIKLLDPELASEDIISLIRNQRSPRALNNKLFCDFINYGF